LLRCVIVKLKRRVQALPRQLKTPHPPAMMDKAKTLWRLVEIGGAKRPAFVKEGVRREVVEDGHEELVALQAIEETNRQPWTNSRTCQP